MIDILSAAGYTIYTEMAKPLLFRLPADSVHESMVTSGAGLQQIPPLLSVMRQALRYDDPRLHTTVAGINFSTPIGLSAGLDKDGKLARLMQAVGFGFVEIGSVTHQAYAGNPQPWYTRLPKSQSILVNAGLKSEGAAAVVRRMQQRYDSAFTDTFPLNVSVAKTNTLENCQPAEAVADYCATLQLFVSANVAQLYTLNISCPNTFGGEPFTTPELLAELLDGVAKLHITKPVFIKLPIDKSWAATDKLLHTAARYDFVKGITVGNLYKDRDNVQLQDPMPAGAGNFSGKPCWQASNDLLARGYHAYGDRFAFSGVGGVFTAADAYQKIRLGASLVQMVTGLIFQGPAVVGRISKGLAELLEKDKYASVAEAVGADNPRTKGK